MQPAYFSATVIAVVLMQTAALLILFQWMSNLMNKVLTALQTSTNLAASKDLTTFQRLQTTTQPQSQEEVVEQVHPLNDAAMAHLLADQFEKQGLDPNLAYAQEDDQSFAKEFGL